MKRKRFLRGFSAFLVCVMMLSQISFAMPSGKIMGRKALRVEDPAAGPVLAAPAAASVVGVRPTFAWGPILGDKSKIKLWISEDGTFNTGVREVNFATAPVVSINSSRDSYTISGGDPALDYGKIYYWKMAFENTPGIFTWSGINTITTTKSIASQPTGNLEMTPVTNVVANPGSDKVVLNWDATPGATGYYILADGTEVFSTTPSYTQTGLTVGTTHKYSVRAVNIDTAGPWSTEVSATTKENPQISVDASSVVETAENGKLIRVNLTNGTFRSDGTYNTFTVVINPADLPSGVTEGAVTYVSGTQITIALSGNRTVDYDTNKTIHITVSKDLFAPVCLENISGTGTITATIEPGPAAPSISFSFSGTDAGKLIGSETTMEYSIDGGVKYLPIGYKNMLIPTKDITAANDIRVRKQAVADAAAGTDKIIDILPGPPMPGIIGNDTNNTISGMSSSMEFSTDGGDIWTSYSNNLPSLTGAITIKVRMKGNGLVAPGDIKSLVFTIPVPAEPSLSLSFSGTDACKILGSTSGMECSIDGGKNYFPINTSNYLININNITGSNDVRVRVAATASNFAGLPKFFDVIDGPSTAPSVTADDALNTISGMTTSMEFTTNNVTWTPYISASSLPNLTGTLLLTVRVKANGLTLPGVSKTIMFTGPAVVAPAPAPAGGGAAPAASAAFPELPSIVGLTAVNATTSKNMCEAMEKMKTALSSTDGVTAEKNAENIGKAANSLKDLATVVSKSTDKAITESLVNGIASLLGSINTAAGNVQGDVNIDKTLDFLSLTYTNAQGVLSVLSDDNQKQRIVEQLSPLIRTASQITENVKTVEKANKTVADFVNGSVSILPSIKDATTANRMSRELAGLAIASMKKVSTQDIVPTFEKSTAKGLLSEAATKDLLARIESISSTKKTMVEKLSVDSKSIDVRMKVNFAGTSAATSVSSELPVSVFSAIKNKGIGSIELGMGIASINLPAETVNVKNITKFSLIVKKVDTGKELTIEQKNVVGNSMVLDFSAAGTDKKGKTLPISSFANDLEVTIPYTVVSGQDSAKLTVFYVNDKGALENKAAIYDPATQTISFRTNHFSKYFIKENKVTFTDLKGREADQLFIEAVAAKGLLLPAKGTQFNPSGAFTKGELAKILISTTSLSKMTDKTIDLKLKDVKKSDPNYKYYYSALKQGILTSDKNGMFKADMKLTREDFAVIMGKWAQASKGWSITKAEVNAMSYGDKGTMKPESLESIALMTKYFVMIAKKGSDYKPADLVERAEVAKVLYRILFTK